MRPLFRLQSYNHVKSLSLPHRPQHTTRHHFASMSATETNVQAAQVANASGITPASLKSTLTEKLEAVYVDVEDISGTLLKVPGLNQKQSKIIT